jgi:hypothetical protein
MTNGQNPEKPLNDEVSSLFETEWDKLSPEEQDELLLEGLDPELLNRLEEENDEEVSPELPGNHPS